MARGILLGVAALLAGPTSAAGFLGLFYNAPPGADEYGMRIAAAQGAETIRMPIRWSEVQKARGAPYDWREYDATVLLAAAYRDLARAGER